MSPITQKGDAVCLSVRVQPRSSKSGVAGMYGDQIRICLRSAPVDNAANKECCELVAKALGVPRSSVSVMNGASCRSKVLKVQGIGLATAQAALAPYLDEKKGSKA